MVQATNPTAHKLETDIPEHKKKEARFEKSLTKGLNPTAKAFISIHCVGPSLSDGLGPSMSAGHTLAQCHSVTCKGALSHPSAVNSRYRDPYVTLGPTEHTSKWKNKKKCSIRC